MKKTKLALFQSIISLILCASMLVGTTFAWFTDSVSSGNNLIATGNLDVELEYRDAEGKWVPVTEASNLFEENALWEPGHTEIIYLKISNLGQLALKYQFGVNIVQELGSVNVAGEAFRLSDHIQFGIVSSNQEIPVYASREAARSALTQTQAINAGFSSEGKLYSVGNVPEGGCTEQYVTLVAYMPEDVGNAANYRTGENPPSITLGIAVVASQEAHESDSFGNDYDVKAELPAFEFPVPEINENVSANVTPDAENKVSQALTLQGQQAAAAIPAGVQMAEGASALTLTVSTLETTGSNVTIGEAEDMISLDVHVEGVAQDNATPMTITLNCVAPIGLNSTSLKLYHVENGETVPMEMIGANDDFTSHNQFKYNPATGDVTLYMASFSEVAMVADTENAWEGEFDYSWYDASKTELTIANADQLAAFGAIVGGMAEGIKRDSFEGKTVELIADINLGDAEAKNNPDLIFYPIGYYYNGDSSAPSSTVYSFEGTFDGSGHTISNFYQNTWEIKGDYDGNYYKDAMGLFGYVVNGTVKNLTVDNFSSDGEYTPTGVIAAYADGKSTFENIAITNCNPRVYNTGNGGIIGVAGDTGDKDTKITLKNITVDNSNKISALWGSWDVACGGLVGMYRGNVDGNGNATGDTISFENCHVSAIIDVYNDVCANYQYYAYRYAGMIIGSVRHNTTNDDGKTIPNMTGISATGCTVNYGDWNDYYYCEFEKNSMASYSEDYQFSRVDKSEISFDENGKATGCTHNHTDAEDKRAVYLPFHQLFTGYSWGVSSVGLEKYSGVVTNLDITEGDQEDSDTKFVSKFTGDFLYRVGNQNAVSVGSLFAAKDGATINHSGVVVSIDKVDENTNVSGTFTANTTDWTKGTILFSGTGVVKVTIQDYNFCTPTVLYLEVVDAVNATSATDATANNVVLLNDCGLSSLTVSGRYTFYGNGFTCTYTGNGQYLNNGLKQGIINVSENGTLDNLRIVASIYPSSYMYYEEVKKGPNSTEGEKVRYHYQLSAVAASGNATISNCYIYGGRNNIYVNTDNVTIKDSILECGTLANVQIQSNSNHTITFENVTTIQTRVNATIGNTDAVMLGAGIIVGPETVDNPTIVINGDFKQYNWVNESDYTAVSNSTAQTIIKTALDTTMFNHTVNGETASNLGIIYLNGYKAEVKNNTSLPYYLETVEMLGQSGQVYSLKNATSSQISSDINGADKTTVNGYYEPQFKYSADLGGQYSADEGGDSFFYREGDTIYVMFPEGDTKELNLSSLVSIEKYSGQNLNLEITCKDGDGNSVVVTNGKINLSKAGEYTVTYTVTDKLFYDKDGHQLNVSEAARAVTVETKTYSWNITVSVSLKDTKISDAYFAFDATKQKMGYYKPTIGDVKQYIPFLAGLKIYDYTGEEVYLRFDGDADFNKVASITITGYTSNEAYIEVKLTDGGVINTKFLARADSGGGSTYTGKIKTSNNTIYFVTDSGTSNKDATTTQAYWYVDYYKFTGNNGVAIQSAQQTFNSSGSSASTPSGNFTTIIKYTVTYNANEGNCAQTVGYATSVATAVTLPTPARSDYIFAGWYTAASGGTRVGGVGESYTPSANITLYAQWGKPCNVTYNANGGSCGTTSEKYSGTALTLPAPTRDGYWFIGWYDAAEGGNKIGDAGAKYNPAGEITLYAHWQEAIKYTVTYNANSGSCGTASATYEGTALTLPTPTKTGYTFNGWYTAASGGTKIGDAGATYIPSANSTLYAQWTINSYTITVTTNNATVKVNGTTVNNNGTVSIQYGAQVTVEVTYSESDNRSTTIKGTDGTTYTSPFTMPAQNVTINATSKKNSTCVTSETMVTLADGTQKRIDAVTYDDLFLVWDFVKGEYTTAPASIVMNHGYGNYTVAALEFSDGTVVKTINGHGFYHSDSKAFVILSESNAEDYIGHSFVKQDGSEVTLKSVTITEEYTESWSVLTAGTYNCILEGMLTLTPAEVEGSPAYLMPFAVGEGMKYDAAAMHADIATYGLYTYEDFADYCTKEQFEAFGLQHFKVAVGKGYITWDGILYLLSIHVG